MGELSEIVRGASPRPIKDKKWFDQNSDVGWLRISDVTEQDGRIHYLSQKLSKDGESKTRVLNSPHLLLSIAASVGKPVINYIKTGVHDGFLIFINPSFNIVFVFEWLEYIRPNWQRYGQPGSQVNLNSDIVKRQNIKFPSSYEQNKISEFLTFLNEYIALHQRKINMLNKLKQNFLINLFPIKGQYSPKLRFNNFKYVWEHHKLGELGRFVRTSVNPQVTSKDEFVEYSMPAFDNGRLPNIVFGGSMQSSRLKISGNVLLINKLNVRQKRIWLVEDAPENAVCSSEFMPYISKKISLEFLQQLMLSDKSTHDLESISSGTSNSQKRITPTDLLKFKVMIPIDGEEQNKIGTFLNLLDNKLNLHQQKIDTIVKLKRIYLHKMFL